MYCKRRRINSVCDSPHIVSYKKLGVHANQMAGNGFWFTQCTWRTQLQNLQRDLYVWRSIRLQRLRIFRPQWLMLTRKWQNLATTLCCRLRSWKLLRIKELLSCWSLLWQTSKVLHELLFYLFWDFWKKLCLQMDHCLWQFLIHLCKVILFTFLDLVINFVIYDM